MLLAAEAASETSWPDVAMVLGVLVFIAVIFWMWVRFLDG